METAIIYDKWLSGMGGGEVVACNMATCLRDSGYKVTILSHEKVSPDEIYFKLGIDMKGISFTTGLSPKPSALNPPDLFINISFMDYSYGIGKRNIYYVHFPSKIRSGLFNYVLQLFSFIKNNFPIPYSFIPKPFQERVNDRLRAGIYPDMKKRLDSYDTFITHSEYVKKWTKKLWNKDTLVLYPPVSLIGAKTEAAKETEGRGTASVNRVVVKNNWITSIGRFFTLGHGKKQEVMIEAFKRLTEAVKERSGETAPVNSAWELHLVGGVGNEPSSLRFIKQLQEQAKGYPIYFHFDASRSEVEEILCKSKIYWHAAGYGENPDNDPIKFEHFGIAPIEAISAGCLPVLFSGGGLTEILEILGLHKGRYQFKSIEELVNITKNLIENSDSALVQSLQIKANQLFSLERFTENFLRVVR